jgi:hypothetical protein
LYLPAISGSGAGALLVVVVVLLVFFAASVFVGVVEEVELPADLQPITHAISRTTASAA